MLIERMSHHMMILYGPMLLLSALCVSQCFSEGAAFGRGPRATALFSLQSIKSKRVPQRRHRSAILPLRSQLLTFKSEMNKGPTVANPGDLPRREQKISISPISKQKRITPKMPGILGRPSVAKNFKQIQQIEGQHRESRGQVRQAPSFVPQGGFEVVTNAASRNHENVPQVSSRVGRTVGETSSSLIKRLCDTKGQKTTGCYRHGASRCTCTGGLADCSGKQYAPNLRYIPQLPSVVKCVRFTHNHVTSLTESFFANVSNFLVVDFSSNFLEKVSVKTFARFTNLQYLILNDNSMSYKHLRNVLEFPPHFRLDLIGLRLEAMPDGYFKPYSHMPTQQIYLDFNYIQHLDFRQMSNLVNLQYLSMTNCSVSTVTSDSMLSLKVLNLNFNNILQFPQTCRNATLFPRLKEMYLGTNNIQVFPAPGSLCLPELEMLRLNNNNISQFRSNSIKNLPSLKVLALDGMQSGISRIEPSAFANARYSSHYMSNNRIEFNSVNISAEMFNTCVSIVVMDLGHNSFKNLNDKNFQALFGDTRGMSYLYLGSAQIDSIPSKALSSMKKLKHLYLYLNNIKNIHQGAFDSMDRLENLNLAQNKINKVKPDAFSDKVKDRLKVIDLSKNPYLCQCDLLWFQTWLKDAGPATFENALEGYVCSDRPGMRVQDYVLSVQACLYGRNVYILFVICFSILLFLFITFVTLFRYRWHIRLLMYERRAARDANTRILAQDDRDFRYDLFVVYCNDDTDWVVDVLLPKIEERWRLQACIHERDFLCGRYIVDNIADSMNSSQQILVLLSSMFAHSNWCNYELQLCQSHVINHSLPSIIVIQLDDIESRDMSASMLALHNTTSFLAWPTNPRHVGWFWGVLKTRLDPLIEARRRRLDAAGGDDLTEAKQVLD